MDNELQSLSDILSESSSEDSSLITEDIIIRDEKCCSEVFDKTVEIKFTESILEIDDCSSINTDSKTIRNNLVLDLRNLNQINDFQNAEEEKYNEKLSEVIEEPEDITPEVTIIFDQELPPPPSSSRCKGTSEKSLALQGRISSLKNLMLLLREELKNEVSLWRKERNEFQILQEKSDIIALEEATAAARAAAEAYAAESPLSDNLNSMQYNNCCNFVSSGEILDVNPEQILSELTILEYEKKLAKYQDALALAQAEKRYNMRRQLAANTYRQKLIEVERLCDEELEKIKINHSSLQPLKQMVSQWYKSDRCGGDADAGDKSSPPGFNSLQKSYSRSNNFCDTTNIANKIDAEVNMAPEIFVAKFNNVDDNDFLFRKGTGFRGENNRPDLNRNIIASGVNSPLSLKWESSNYNLSTSLGKP